MIAYLSKTQVLHIHQRQVEHFGGAPGLRDEGALDSALARAQATFAGEDLYPTLADKAAALLHSLISNHPFVDGNKRVAAMSAELFMLVNGFEIQASDDDTEELVMSAERGELAAEQISIWIEQRLRPLR